MLRFLTAGESHGKALVVIVEGLPSGLEVKKEDISAELGRRRLGFGRGPRMRFEQDEVTVLSGVRFGKSLGSPIAIEILNTEWPKWEVEMSVETGESKKILTTPRPGHADLAGMQKYNLIDARDVLERASARETAARVAAGSVAKVFLKSIGISILSHVVSIGSVRVDSSAELPKFEDLEVIDASEVRCFDVNFEDAMVNEIKAAAKDGDSLGGTVEVVAYGVPVGIGSHVHWDRKLDGLLAHALMSIQAVKVVEIGEGIDIAFRRGSEAHDPIHWDKENESFRRFSHNSGGIEGGISTGEPIVVRASMKPLATLNRPVLKTVDVKTKEETVSFKERTDVTAVPALGVVSETMVALVLASEVLRKFGGDSIGEIKSNVESYKNQLKTQLKN